MYRQRQSHAANHGIKPNVAKVAHTYSKAGGKLPGRGRDVWKSAEMRLGVSFEQ